MYVCRFWEAALDDKGLYVCVCMYVRIYVALDDKGMNVCMYICM